ncbi:hypothetical protein [Azospirillum sp. ST 5-10]|uniref:hypothetical protein n=1 Tax=unclassified Azospirillum TaxID=2630922 RepID=UPI003F4A2342
MRGGLLSAVEKAAKAGRGTDSMVAHVTPGEMVIPRRHVTPGLLRLLEKQGLDVRRYTVGDKAGPRNPKTGAEEFEDSDSDGTGSGPGGSGDGSANGGGDPGAASDAGGGTSGVGGGGDGYGGYGGYADGIGGSVTTDTLGGYTGGYDTLGAPAGTEGGGLVDMGFVNNYTRAPATIDFQPSLGGLLSFAGFAPGTALNTTTGMREGAIGFSPENAALGALSMAGLAPVAAAIGLGAKLSGYTPGYSTLDQLGRSVTGATTGTQGATTTAGGAPASSGTVGAMDPGRPDVGGDGNDGVGGVVAGAPFAPTAGTAPGAAAPVVTPQMPAGDLRQYGFGGEHQWFGPNYGLLSYAAKPTEAQPETPANPILAALQRQRGRR